MGAVDIGGGAVGPIPAHARTVDKVGPVDRQGIGYPSRRRRGRVQARRRRDWVVDREGLGIGGPASRRTGEDGHTGRPGRGNVRSQDGSRQLGAVDIGGGAIGSIPAHGRAVNKVGPVDRQGIGYPSRRRRGRVQARRRRDWVVDREGLGIGGPASRRAGEDGHTGRPGCGNVRSQDGSRQLGAVDIGGGAVGPIPAHARTINKVGPVDRQGIGYPSRRRRGRVQARRRRDWVVDREGLGIGGPASRRAGEDGHTGRPGRGNVRSQDGSRQLGAVDIGGGAIGSIPAHVEPLTKLVPLTVRVRLSLPPSPRSGSGSSSSGLGC